MNPRLVISLALTLTLTLSLSLTLTACAGVDRFSSRALTYNDQAETIKEQEFLLNIMRAAYREPLQFSDFTQVTGQTSLSGTAAFTLPFSTFPSSLARTYYAAPSATISGNQSFTIVNLNTQDFYEGILHPIPMGIIDYYMQSDYPKALVLTLLVQHIVLQPPPGHQPIVFENNYVNDNYAKFETVLQTAINLGLTTETVNAARPIGPPMTAAQLSQLRYLTALNTTGATLKTYQLGGKMSDPLLTPPETATLKAEHAGEYYRLVTIAPEVHFCFETNGDISQATVHAVDTTLSNAGVLPQGDVLTGIKIPQPNACGAAAESGAAATDDSAGHMVEFDVSDAGSAQTLQYKINISPRSVESILYYLGEWTRAELKIDPNATARPPTIFTDRDHGTNTPDTLFSVSQDCPQTLPSVATTYHNSTYCVAVDPTGADRSAQVMEIVGQLFALNNSAKDLPASSLISVLSP